MSQFDPGQTSDLGVSALAERHSRDTSNTGLVETGEVVDAPHSVVNLRQY